MRWNPSPTTQNQKGRTLKILLLDLVDDGDETVIQRQVSHFLRHRENEIKRARNGDEASELCFRGGFSPNLIIVHVGNRPLRINGPERDFFYDLRKVDRRLKRRAIPVACIHGEFNPIRHDGTIGKPVGFFQAPPSLLRIAHILHMDWLNDAPAASKA